jgi:murein DD-endopeptidase MepM/ murein hydrolase activator NlpD
VDLRKPIPLAGRYRKRTGLWLGISALVVFMIVGGYLLLREFGRTAIHFQRLRDYWNDPDKYSHWSLHAGTRCGEAPFLIPTDGFVAFFWGDRYSSGKKHQGVDIFSPSGRDEIGVTPVVAAYDGYLTRLSDWRSAVIIRIPEDPLQPGRQIWIYYAHMADPEGNSFIVSDYPPGTHEKYVAAGTLLGYQGNYSADPDNPTGVHLHFSIVLDDGKGHYLNELEFHNTLDPSAYLGVELNSDRIGDRIAVCNQEGA